MNNISNPILSKDPLVATGAQGLKGPGPLQPRVYVDLTKEGKLLSYSKTTYDLPEIKPRRFMHHESFGDLLCYIAEKRNPKLASMGKEQKLALKEVSDLSFSAVNRAAIETKTTLSPHLKKILGIAHKTDDAFKDFFVSRSQYKYNSECNGHCYRNQAGQKVFLTSAIASSADRKSLHIQNLSKIEYGVHRSIYTGRPDTPEKAKEQALFLLSDKLGVKDLKEVSLSKPDSAEAPHCCTGLNWNPKTRTLHFPYVVYSIMSDSSLQSFLFQLLGDKHSNEKQLLSEEKKTLETLSRAPMRVQDDKGAVFNVHFQPILLSQGFNAFDTFKGFVGEGSLSPSITAQGWRELKALIEKRPFAAKTVQNHIEILDKYMEGSIYLSNLHLFLHLNVVIGEIDQNKHRLPLILHCKSSTDRTGIAAALVAALTQYKTLYYTLPYDMTSLCSDPKFKELFALNWVPSWHPRTKYSRDTHGISFGKGIAQNPILLEVLPSRFLKEKSEKKIRAHLWTNFNFTWISATLGFFYSLFAARIPHMFSECMSQMPLAQSEASLQKHRERKDRYNYFKAQSLGPKSALPTIYLDDKIKKYRSKVRAPLSPLAKERLSS